MLASRSDLQRYLIVIELENVSPNVLGLSYEDQINVLSSLKCFNVCSGKRPLHQPQWLTLHCDYYWIHACYDNLQP